MSNDSDGAIAEARSAARIAPTSAAAHRMLGELLRAIGDRLGAVQEYRAAVKHDAADADSFLRLAGLCESKRTHLIHARETQIDCEGFDFRGQGRHVEFVFRDDRLVIVWLMVTPPEGAAIIAAMTQAYGAPSAREPAYVLFAPQRAAWRFEPAEILFYAPQIDDNVAFELTH